MHSMNVTSEQSSVLSNSVICQLKKVIWS